MKFFAYSGTMQEVCLCLMGKKLLVALAMEGKFASEGVQAIDGDDDLLTAMALLSLFDCLPRGILAHCAKQHTARMHLRWVIAAGPRCSWLFDASVRGIRRTA